MSVPGVVLSPVRWVIDAVPSVTHGSFVSNFRVTLTPALEVPISP